jgi:hypothetical protein
MKLLIILTAFLVISSAEARDPKEVDAFRKLNACPATQSTKGACPGWVVDHIIPLCAGGLDGPSNMQWQDHATSVEKDKTEWALCVWIRRAHHLKPLPVEEDK